MQFILHHQLAKDCLHIGQMPLCALLLMNDASYPWFILVPRRIAIKEIYQLDMDDQQQLLVESSVLARCLNDTLAADKINIAALGNIVPQLHIHHIARYTTDPAWPAPVWGKQPARPYHSSELESLINKIRTPLTKLVDFNV